MLDRSTNVFVLTDIVFNFICRRFIIESSRHFKNLFHEVKERASKALGFAKMLRKVSRRLFYIIIVNLSNTDLNSAWMAIRHVNDIASGDIAIYIFDRDVDL